MYMLEQLESARTELKYISCLFLYYVSVACGIDVRMFSSFMNKTWNSF